MSATEVILIGEEVKPTIDLKLHIRVDGLEGSKAGYRRELRRLAEEAKGEHHSSIYHLLRGIANKIE